MKILALIESWIILILFNIICLLHSPWKPVETSKGYDVLLGLCLIFWSIFTIGFSLFSIVKETLEGN